MDTAERQVSTCFSFRLHSLTSSCKTPSRITPVRVCSIVFIAVVIVL